MSPMALLLVGLRESFYQDRGLSLQQYLLHITPTFLSFNFIFYITLMHKAGIPHDFACFFGYIILYLSNLQIK